MQVLDYIFCDDIRFEIRGKFSMIGLYHDSINIEAKNPETIIWPINLRIGVLVRVKLDASTELQSEMGFRFSLKYNGEECASSEGSLGISSPSPGIVAFPMGPYMVPVKEAGNFTFNLRLRNADKEIAVLDSPFPLPVRVREVR